MRNELFKWDLISRENKTGSLDELLIELGKAESLISVVLEDEFMNGDRNKMYHYFWVLSDVIQKASQICEMIDV